MLTGDLIRASLAAAKAKPKPGKLDYRQFMPETLGFEAPDQMLLESQLPNIQQRGQNATLMQQTLAQNQANKELMLRSLRDLRGLRGQYNEARAEQPILRDLGKGFNGPLTGLRGTWLTLPTGTMASASSYGWRINPVTGKKSFHTGVDFAGSMGQPIRAVADGVIKKARMDNIYGNQIIMGMGQHYQTMYGHLSRILVQPGQKVRRGQIIGYVGSTGWSTGPHLHFESWFRHNPYNPISGNRWRKKG